MIRGKLQPMRALLALILLAAALPATAQFYRWTDESGKVHFSDTPPPPSARNVQRKSGGTSSGGESTEAAQPYAVQQAMRDYPVTLYTGENCEGCGEARKLLNARGVPFREVMVASEAQLTELKNAVGSNSVPAMLVGPSVLKGFEAGQYNGALDAAGYPKAGILPPRNQAEPSTAAPQKPEAAAEPPPARRGPYAR
jgi:glutaredoxin